MNYLSPLYPRVLRSLDGDENRFIGRSAESVQVKMYIEALEYQLPKRISVHNIAEHALVSLKIYKVNDLDLNQYAGKDDALEIELTRIDGLRHDDFPYDAGFCLSFAGRLVQHPYPGEDYLSAVSREARNDHFMGAVRNSLSIKKLKSNLEFFTTLPKLYGEAFNHGETVRRAKQKEKNDASGIGDGMSLAGCGSTGLTRPEYPRTHEENVANWKRWIHYMNTGR